MKQLFINAAKFSNSFVIIRMLQSEIDWKFIHKINYNNDKNQLGQKTRKTPKAYMNFGKLQQLGKWSNC